MSKKKFIVYDPSKGYSRIIKHYFNDVFDIEICRINKTIEIEPNYFEIAFVLINEYQDLVSFIDLNAKVNCVFCTTNLKDVELVLKDIEKLIFIDFYLTKIDFINKIKESIDLL